MTPNPNWLAIFALAIWPLASLYFYGTRSVTQATLWTILGAYLLLPVGAAVHFAGIPQLDKETSGNLGALLGIFLILKRPLRLWNGFGVPEVLLVTLLVSPFVTEELNLDPIIFSKYIVPAGSTYDGLSEVVRQLLLLIPFFVGRQFLRSSQDIRAIMRTLVIAGLLYSLPILFEIRMSPTIHSWVYGYFPSSYVENLRWGGYRPVVFLGHGLPVALFVMTAAVAAATLWRTRTRLAGLPLGGITAYLTVVLVLCKALGSLIYGAVLIPLVYLTSPRFQARVAVVLVTIALVYPLLRLADLVPAQGLVEISAQVSEDRSGSLETRLLNEKQLLEKASQRFLFGWGRFGRNLIYDKSGHDISIPDGEWVIVLGMFGLVGFVAEFGLLVLPVYRVAAALKFAKSAHDRIYIAALALISATNTFDLLPNSGLSPWTWLLAGALLGRAELLRVTARERKKFDVLPSQRQRGKALPASR